MAIDTPRYIYFDNREDVVDFIEAILESDGFDEKKIGEDDWLHIQINHTRFSLYMTYAALFRFVKNLKRTRKKIWKAPRA